MPPPRVRVADRCRPNLTAGRGVAGGCGGAGERDQPGALRDCWGRRRWRSLHAGTLQPAEAARVMCPRLPAGCACAAPSAAAALRVRRSPPPPAPTTRAVRLLLEHHPSPAPPPPPRHSPPNSPPPCPPTARRSPPPHALPASTTLNPTTCASINPPTAGVRRPPWL